MQYQQTLSSDSSNRKSFRKHIGTVCGLAAYLVLLRRSYFATMLHADDIENGLLEPYYAFFLAAVTISAFAVFFAARHIEGRAQERPQGKVAYIGLAFLSIIGAMIAYVATSGSSVSPTILVAGIIAFALGTTSLAMFLTNIIVSSVDSKKTIGIIVTLAYLLSALITLGSTLLPDNLKVAFVIGCPLISFVAWLASGTGSRENVLFALEISHNINLSDLGFLAAIYLICSIMLGCNFTPSLSTVETPVYFGTHGLLLAACFVLVMIFVFAPGDRRSIFVFELIGIFAFVALFFFSALLDAGWVSLSANVVASARLCFELLLWIVVLCALKEERLSAFMGAAAFLALRTVSDVLINLAIPQFVAAFGSPATEAIHKVALALFFLMALGFATVKIVEFAKGTEYVRVPEDESQNLSENCTLLSAQFKLSKREGEILQYVARGYSSRWIAETLCISVSTVQTHTKSIYRKLGVHNKQDLLELVSPFGKTNSDTK